MKGRNIPLLVTLIIILFCLQNISSALTTNISTAEDDEADSITNELPSYFSWRDIDGVDWTTPIRAQQPYAACEAFAFVAALEVMAHIEVGYPFGCDLSEAHLYFWSGGNTGWGSYPENDTNYLVEYGVPDEACWPWPGYLDHAVQFPKNTTCDNWQDRTVKIKNWSYLPPNNITLIKELIINNGPVPAHFHSYEDFGYYTGGVYTHKWGDIGGLHCVCLMGYKDDPKIPSGGYWIVKNSWGTHLRTGRPVGEDGWARIAYGEGSIEEMAVLFEGIYGNFPILYVDDDNTAGPWDGSKENPYQSIQEAIDEAYDGWTVYVKNGTYNENIIINKTVNLDGENPDTTVIDGSNQGIVVYVQAPNVRITGLTIQNSGSKRLDSGIRTLSLDTNFTLKNCILQNNDVGLYLNCGDFETFTGAENIVENNTITKNSIGIFTVWVEKNTIQNNKIYDNLEHGVEMEASRYSTLKNNEIYDNGGVGILMHGVCDESQILGNLIENNSQGILLKDTDKCKISDNNFVNNDEQASFVRSRGNRWTGNYWSDWEKILPRPIRGTLNLLNLPCINFDWRPSINQI